jgi:hypothetical protein
MAAQEDPALIAIPAIPMKLRFNGGWLLVNDVAREVLINPAPQIAMRLRSAVSLIAGAIADLTRGPGWANNRQGHGG